MVMGNVDSKTLIKKLTKAGKHAELWPEKSASKKKKQGKSKKKEKQSDPESREDSSQVSDEDEKEGVKVVVQDTGKNGEGGMPNKNGEGCGCAAGKSGVQFQAPGPELKQFVNISAGNQPGCNENEARNEGGGGGSKKKKKKKKGQKGKNSGAEGGECSVDAPANQAQVQVPEAVSNIPSHANQNAPGHHIGHQCPPHYHYAPLVYGVNHHTAYPNSYSTAYYNSKGSYSYAHMHPSDEKGMEPPLYDSEPYTLQPSDSFAFLSDENPNGCAVM